MNIYIVNRSNHDFSKAEQYGRITFLSKGPMNRYSTNNILRTFTEKMRGSTEYDYIVPCSLNIMNAIACSLFTYKHSKLNLLLFKDGSYIERNHTFFMGDEVN